MVFSNFKYSKKHDTFRTIINMYNFKKEDVSVYTRADYKIVVTDNIIEDIIDVPDRIKITNVICHYVDDRKTLLMIELKLKDLDIKVNWK